MFEVGGEECGNNEVEFINYAVFLTLLLETRVLYILGHTFINVRTGFWKNSKK